MSKKEVKTNAMRMLDRAKVSYTYEEYECDDFTEIGRASCRERV